MRTTTRISAFWGTVLLLALLVSTSSAQERDPMSHFFQPFFDELDEEINTARDENKKGVLLMFEEDDCPFCARMKATILNQPEVQDYFREHFRIVAIDKEGDIEITDFNGETITMKDFAEKRHRVRATPVFMMVDLDGNMMKRGRYTGAMTSVEEFLSWGRFFAEGINEKMSFTGYKRSLAQ